MREPRKQEEAREGQDEVSGRKKPEGELQDLNAQEIAEAMEGMRAQIAQLERQRVRDQEEASGRERRLEKENAMLLSALSRGIGQ